MVAAGQRKVRIILEWIGSGRVLDVGSNDGGIAHAIVLKNGAHVIAADRLRYVEIARREYGLPVVALEAAHPLPFADGSFDALLISGVLEYLAAPLALLKEARRVLVPGGRLVLVAPNNNSLRRIYRRWRGRPPAPEERFVLQQLREMLGEAGFTIRAFRPCPYREEANWPLRLASFLEKIVPGKFATDFAFLCAVH